MLTTHNLFMQSNIVSIIQKTRTAFLYCSFCVGAFVLRAGAQSSGNTSPIWGNVNSSQNMISEPLHNDPTWGVLPSDQILNSDTARMRLARNLHNLQRRQQARDALGNPLRTDVQGNVLYDAYGNPLIDSSRMNQSSATSIDDNTINSGPVIPPDDPVDIPIDGGVGILLMIGVGIGYKNSRKRKIATLTVV